MQAKEPTMEALLASIRECNACAQHLPAGPRPVMSAAEHSKILIIGQAPGQKVHASGIPWDDPSGKQLRKWLAVDETTFYNPDCFGILPMGFCYPGKGRSGDLPPRPECAPLWHEALMARMPSVQLTILIGQYAQNYYLPDNQSQQLTLRVKNFREYLPERIPLPHPSPRNRFWLAKNPWFEAEVIPALQERVKDVLGII